MKSPAPALRTTANSGAGILSLPFSHPGCSWRDRGRLAVGHTAPRTPNVFRALFGTNGDLRRGRRSPGSEANTQTGGDSVAGTQREAKSYAAWRV
jgi:hypothetical protein